MPDLSVLIPSIPERNGAAMILYHKLQSYVNDCCNADVEILLFMDNKKRTIGEKRDQLVQAAKGEYLSFVDDDEDIFPEYIKEITSAIHSGNYDLIMYNSRASLGQNEFTVDVSLDNENEQHAVNGIMKRKPFHVCCWRTFIAQSERFNKMNYGEDWDWCKRLIPKINSYYKIDKVLHHYKYDPNIQHAEPD